MDLSEVEWEDQAETVSGEEVLLCLAHYPTNEGLEALVTLCISAREVQSWSPTEPKPEAIPGLADSSSNYEIVLSLSESQEH